MNDTPLDHISPCGCGRHADSGRKAAGVDPELKEANLKRLKRIEGQVRGIARMVEEDRYCPEILMQVSAVQEALRGVSRRLMQNHLRHCTTTAIKAGDEQAEAACAELVDLMFKSAR